MTPIDPVCLFLPTLGLLFVVYKKKSTVEESLL